MIRDIVTTMAGVMAAAWRNGGCHQPWRNVVSHQQLGVWRIAYLGSRISSSSNINMSPLATRPS